MSSTQQKRSLSRNSDLTMLVGVVLCFVLSGFAALLYQTAWLRQFSLVFGTSELAVATVLATYMAGLAMGAAIAARLVNRILRPVLVYGLLEAGIAISALAVPALLAGAGMLYVYFLGGQAEPPSSNSIGQPVFYLVVGFVVLMIPTGLMGATLPLLIRYAVTTDSQVGPRVALLYSSNTAGAVIGALIAGFLLLPNLGLRATVYCGVAINLLVFVIAALLAKRAPTASADASLIVSPQVLTTPGNFYVACIRPWLDTGRTWSQKCDFVFRERVVWILPLILVSGFNAFLYEVLWTRLLSHVLGGSIYAFTTMLAAFLTGIAVGSAIAGRMTKTRQRAAAFFAGVQVAIAVLSVAAYYGMQTLAPDTRALSVLAGYAFAVMIPATLFIGATFPLAVRVLSYDEQSVSVSTARVYSWNTVGAIGGAILASFYIIPALGFEGSIKLAILINLTLSLFTVFFLLRKPLPLSLGIFTVTIAVFFIYQPQRPSIIVNATGFALPVYDHTEEVYSAVGRSTTVLLNQRGGYFDLRTNGLPEASITAKGVPPASVSEKWLTALPITARPEARSVLVVGLGGGVALEGIPASVKEVDVIELEPEVIAANEAIGELRKINPLTDPRVTLIVNDARNALRLTNKKYDIIVSQPSHPWTAGASHLFTREFIALVRQHLSESGVLLQWINSQFVSANLLRSLTATLRAEFTHVRLYQPEPTVLMFLASNSPLQVEQEMARSGKPMRDDVLFYSSVGINGIEDLLAALVLDNDGTRAFSLGAPLSTDDNNLMATRSRSLADGLNPRELATLFEANDPLLNRNSWVYSIPGHSLNMPYLASRLLKNNFLTRYDKLIDTTLDRATKYLLTGLRLEDAGRQDEAAQVYAAGLRENPGDKYLPYLAIQADLGSLALGTASKQTTSIAANLRGAPLAVARGWSAALKQDWRSLAALDRALATSEVTDPWFDKVAQLRAEWRTKVVGNSAFRMATDALRIADRGLQLSPSLDLYVLRAAAAAELNDGAVFVESAAVVAAYIRSKLTRAAKDEYHISEDEMAAMKGRVRALSRGVQSGLAGTSARRTKNVQNELKKIKDQLDRFTLEDQPN